MDYTKQAKDKSLYFNMNILFAGDKLTDAYIIMLQKALLDNKNSNDILPWNTFDFRDTFNLDLLQTVQSTQSNPSSKRREELYGNNVLLCVTDSLTSEYTSNLMEFLTKQSGKLEPFIIFSTLTKDEQVALDQFRKKYEGDYDMRQITFLPHFENDSFEVMEKLFQVCCYYNQLGDLLGFPGVIARRSNKNQLFTLNMIIVGNSGGGKSALVNILLDEKKAKEGKSKGLPAPEPETQCIMKYHHTKYPLVFIDTPGLCPSNYKSLIDYIQSNSPGSTNPSKNNLHLIIYVKSSKQSGIEAHEQLFLSKINSISHLPIFYLLTGNDNANTFSKSKASFLNHYAQLIQPKHLKNVCLTNLIKPNIGIAMLIDQIFSTLHVNSSFKATVLNPKSYSIEDFFISIRNQIFEFLLKYRSISLPSQIESPEVQREAQELVNSIYAVYGIEVNEQWDEVIKQRAMNSYSNMLFNSAFFMKDIYRIKEEVKSRIDCSSYLTYIAIEAYLQIERQINQRGDLFNCGLYLEKEFLLLMESFVKDMLDKYHS